MIRVFCLFLFLIAGLVTLAHTDLHAQGCGPANPNCIVPTAPAGTSDNRAASTAFVQGVTNSYSGNHQIGQLDCGGTVYVTGAFTTVTLASAASIKGRCLVFVVNGSSTRGQVLSGFPSSLPALFGAAGLWPNQGMAIQVVGSSWVVVIAPGRFATASATLFVAAAGCSNNNDGLVSGAPLCSINTCVALFNSSFDSLGTNPTCNLVAGSFTEAVNINSLAGNIFNAINIVGNGSTLTATAGNPVIAMREHIGVILSNITLVCNGNSAVSVTEFPILDLVTVTFGSCTGQVMVNISEEGKINVGPGTTISGNAAAFANINGTGSYLIIGGVVTCTGNPAFSTAFVIAANLAYIDATSSSYSGCGGATGTRYIVGNSVINTNGGGANFFPGNAPGTGSVGAFGLYE